MLAARSVLAAPDGAALYRESCAPCHGESGRGDGPEARYFIPPPTDLRGGVLEQADEDRLVARLLVGASLGLAPDVAALRERLRQVDDLTRHLQRLPSIDWVKVDAGAEVFEQRCAVCHGPLGKPLPLSSLPPGVQKPPRDLWDPRFQLDTSDDEMVAVIEHGHRAMPAIPGLQSDAKARALLPFIRLLSLGFETYSYYCAACHGDEGRGEGAFAAGAEKPRVVFDRAWLASKNPAQLRVDVVHMLSQHAARMPHFKDVLTEEELRAVLRHLKRTQPR